MNRLAESEVKRVYAAIDAPRNDAERADAAEMRKVLDEFDGRFEIIRRFAESNQGCRRWVSSSISWFFQHEEFGIILEEDILLDKRFVAWCAALRSRRDSLGPCIMHINSFFPGTPDLEAPGPSFTRYPTSWGWATWRDAWQFYDDAMGAFDNTGLIGRVRMLKDFLQCGWALAIHYALALEMARQGKLSSWAYRWDLSIWRRRGLCLSPGVNLSQNIGFGADATHTSDEGLERYRITPGEAPISLDILPLDPGLEQQVFFRVTKADSLARSARMFVSTLVPNRFFFFVRRKFRG